MKKEYLLNAVQRMPKPVKPKIPKAAVAGFIAGGAVAVAAAAAVGYFFLKKKEITLHLCCDITDHDDDECRFEEENDASAENNAENTVNASAEPTAEAAADTIGADSDDEPAVKSAQRGEEVSESTESPCD